MSYEKHPSYGYLTKDEYEAMKKASYGDAKEYQAIAKKREAAAKRNSARNNPQPSNRN